MRKVLFFLATVVLATSCSQAQQSKKSGFLTKEELPNAVEILPEPPKSGPEYDKDVEAYELGKKKRQDPKVRDHCLRLDTTDINTVFNEAVGFTLMSKKNKEIKSLVSGAVKDVRKISEPAREYYKRQKPFIVFHEPSLKIDAESAVSTSKYAYPSGHAVRSWMYALVLADVAPEYKKQLYACAQDYSDCRVIMGRHWQSDIDAGKLLSIKVHEKLKQSPAYQEQLKLAREQYKAMEKK